MPIMGHIGALDVMIFRNDHDPPGYGRVGFLAGHGQNCRQ
jgi:hypothetical protein